MKATTKFLSTLVILFSVVFSLQAQITKGLIPSKKLRKTFIDNYFKKEKSKVSKIKTSPSAWRTKPYGKNVEETIYHPDSVRVMTAPVSRRGKTRFGDIQDGTSNTIMVSRSRRKNKNP